MWVCVCVFSKKRKTTLENRLWCTYETTLISPGQGAPTIEIVYCNIDIFLYNAWVFSKSNDNAHLCLIGLISEEIMLG